MTGRDFLHRAQWEEHPTAQHAGSHRREGLVDDIEQGTAAFVHGLHEFEVAGRETVKAHTMVFLDAADGRDVARLRVLRDFQITHHGACCDNGRFQMLHAEALEVVDGEVLAEFFFRRGLIEGPVFKLEDEELAPEETFESLAHSPHDEHFLRREVRQEFVNIFRGAFCHKEFSRGDVEKGDTHTVFAEVDSGKEVVFTR